MNAGMFKVWAPFQSEVWLNIKGNERYPMSKEEGGWWSIYLDNITSGTLYYFDLDDGKSYPDPRSLFQPEGIAGPSQKICLEDHKWQYDHIARVPIHSAVIYEIHVGTFSPEGSFYGILEKLDHLVELGVTHLQLMPIAEFSGSRGWGYDTVFPFAPHHLYGSCFELMNLVDACHERGIGVILDVVFNHIGPIGSVHNQFAPYLAKDHFGQWGNVVNFDGQYSDQVRRYFIDCALMWLRDYHVDGLRIDAVHGIFDQSARPFVTDLNEAVSHLGLMTGSRYFVIAEDNRNEPRILSTAEGGLGFDALWSDDYHHAMHAFFSKEKAGYYQDYGSSRDIINTLEHGFLYEGHYSPFRRKSYGNDLNKNLISHLVHYNQNHDQIGNRVDGKRTSHLLDNDDLFIISTLLILGPAIPMLFQGEEWASQSYFYYFTDHNSEPLNRDIWKGRQAELDNFGWIGHDMMDPESYETFSQSILDWSRLSDRVSESLLFWHRDLIRIRRSGYYEHASVPKAISFVEESVLVISLEATLIMLNLSNEVKFLSGIRTNGMNLLMMKGSLDYVGEDDRIKLGKKSVVIFTRYMVHVGLGRSLHEKNE